MIILDTNVISELMKGDPFPAVFAWASSYPPGDLFTTAITMAEVLYGVERLPRGKRRDQLLREAESVFAEDFAGRILAFDESSARMFAVIATQRRAQGRPIDEPDAQIAAIAKVHGATLATRNTDDFEGCGIRLVNPWKAGQTLRTPFHCHSERSEEPMQSAGSRKMRRSFAAKRRSG